MCSSSNRLLFRCLGFQNFPKSDMVQNRAIRYYLGVHLFTPILALNGDMGWPISLHRRWLNIIRLWKRLVDMDDDRLTKKCSFMILTKIQTVLCAQK